MDPQNDRYGGPYRTEFFASPHPDTRPPGTIGSDSVFFYGAPGADGAHHPHGMHAPHHTHLPVQPGGSLPMSMAGLSLGHPGPTHGPYEHQDNFPALSTDFSSSSGFIQPNSSSMWSHPAPHGSVGSTDSSHQHRGGPAPATTSTLVIPDASLFDVPTSSVSAVGATAPASDSASTSSAGPRGTPTLRADSARFVPRASAPAFVPRFASAAGDASASAAQEEEDEDGGEGDWGIDGEGDDGDVNDEHGRDYGNNDDEDDEDAWLPSMDDAPRTAAEAEALLNSLNARPGAAPPPAGGGTRYWTSSILPMMRNPDPSLSSSSSSSGTASSVDKTSRPVCSFYLQGTCRYGSGCVNRHTLPDGSRACPLCGEDVPAGKEATHATVCPEALAAERERAASTTAECTICLENITRKGQRFGLLSHCNHAFCLPCVREWRESSAGPGSYDKTVVRCCPQCRKVSHFVIPSDRMVDDPVRKAKLAEVYRASLSQVPCKYFDPRTKADCPFGSSCFYAHKDVAGNDCKTTAHRIKVDTEGQVTVVTAPKLSDFIDFDSMKTIKSKKKKKGGSSAAVAAPPASDAGAAAGKGASSSDKGH